MTLEQALLDYVDGVLEGMLEITDRARLGDAIDWQEAKRAEGKILAAREILRVLSASHDG